MTAPAADLTPSTPQSRSSLWEDFIDIFYAPSDVYDRRRDGRFGLAFVVLIVASALLTFGFWNALQPMFEATVDMSLRAAAAKGQNIPPEALAKMRGFGTKMAAVSAVVGLPIGILFTAFLTWVFAKLFDVALDFSRAMTVVTFAQFPRLLGSIVLGVQGLLMANTDKPIFSYMVGPSRFLDPATASPALLGFLTRFELFTIWATVLIGIGVAVIGRTTRAKAAMVAVTVWFVASALSLLQALRA